MHGIPVNSTEVHHPGSTYRSKDRDEQVGALIIIPRTSISLEPITSGIGLVKEMAEAGIQMVHGLHIPGRVLTGTSRPASDRGTEKRGDVAFHTATLSVRSVFVSCRSSGNTEGEPSEEIHEGG